VLLYRVSPLLVKIELEREYTFGPPVRSFTVARIELKTKGRFSAANRVAPLLVGTDLEQEISFS